MRTAAYQAAAYVAGYARRRRFAAVRYDDSDKSWCEEFPWGTLRSRLSALLDEYGISMEIADASAKLKGKGSGPSPEGIL